MQIDVGENVLISRFEDKKLSRIFPTLVLN